jgi:hypothetical protein
VLQPRLALEWLADDLVGKRKYNSTHVVVKGSETFTSEHSGQLLAGLLLDLLSGKDGMSWSTGMSLEENSHLYLIKAAISYIHFNRHISLGHQEYGVITCTISHTDNQTKEK